MPETKLRPEQESNNSHTVALVVIIIVAVALIFGVGSYLFTRFFTGHVKQASEYETTTLVAESYSPTVQVSGTVEAGKSFSVSPEVSGTVKAVKVEEGDKVVKGQVLMTLKNDSIVDAKNSARSSYEKAQNTLEKAENTYDSAKSTYDNLSSQLSALKKARQKILDEDANADVSSYDDYITKYENDTATAKSNLSTAEGSLETARSNAEDLKSSYETALKEYKKLTVTAGMAGTIANLKAKPGISTTTLNKDGAAMEIVDLSTLRAVVDVPESSVSDVLEGNAATVTSSTNSNASTGATVSSIGSITNGNKTDSGESCYTVKLSLKSTKKIKYGMSVEATIQLREYQSAYHVPSTAVSESNGSYYVRVLYDDNTVESREITVLGTDDEGNTVITGNYVSAGVKILTNYDE
ncbi:MAG: efflux RND transporter periplasmic adaptor subunit [Coriobacteriales bacterium]|jgi:HlyD family secretion protein